jgi:hypothetical protein
MASPVIRLIAASLPALLVFTGCAGRERRPAEPVPTASTLPPRGAEAVPGVQVVRVYPTEGSLAGEGQPPVGADVDFLRPSVESLVAATKLLLDGVEIAPGPSVWALDIPGRGASVVYLPPQPLEPGTHRAQVIVESPDQPRTGYSWSFRIE